MNTFIISKNLRKMHVTFQNNNIILLLASHDTIMNVQLKHLRYHTELSTSIRIDGCNHRRAIKGKEFFKYHLILYIMFQEK